MTESLTLTPRVENRRPTEEARLTRLVLPTTACQAKLGGEGGAAGVCGRGQTRDAHLHCHRPHTRSETL